MTKLNISIPEPCHENWATMSPEDKGRFCSSCQKKVFDFTKSSDREIASTFQQNKNLCGRFLDSQLNRDLIKPEKKNPIWLATTSTIISFIGLGTNESSAQTNTVQIEQTKNAIWLGKPAPPKSANENGYIKGEMTAIHPDIEISGIILDEQKLAVPGANISVKGTDKITQTDFDGNFKIKASVNDILLVSFLGYDNKEVLVESKFQNQKIIIHINNSNAYMGEIIIVKKRTFFGRIFHSIGKLFR